MWILGCLSIIYIGAKFQLTHLSNSKIYMYNLTYIKCVFKKYLVLMENPKIMLNERFRHINIFNFDKIWQILI